MLSSVGGELDLVLLDQVLGLAAGAVDAFVEMAGLAGERGDDVARVETARGGLQPVDDPALAAPRAGGVGMSDCLCKRRRGHCAFRPRRGAP